MNNNTSLEKSRMTFSQWWSQDGEWVEPPNERRGGKSGVLRVKRTAGTYYIKRQIGHIHRSWLHPLGRPTVLREEKALLAMSDLNVRTPTLIFSGAQRDTDGQWNALLVTEELSGYIDSDRWFEEGMDQFLSVDARANLMREIGAMLARMHLGRWQHGCLYGKHVFIRNTGDDFQVALLDFEKCRQRLTKSQAANHDIPQLRRHSKFTDSDWSDLLQGYQRIHPCQLKKHH